MNIIKKGLLFISLSFVLFFAFGLKTQTVKAIDLPAGTARRVGAWDIYPLYSDYWALKLSFTGETTYKPSKYILNIPASSDNLVSTSSLTSKIRINYNTSFSSGMTLNYEWTDLQTEGLAGNITSGATIEIDTRAYFIDTDLSALTITSIEVFIAQTPTSDGGARASASAYFNSYDYSYYIYPYFIARYHDADGNVIVNDVIAGKGALPDLGDYIPYDPITISGQNYNFKYWYLITTEGQKVYFPNSVMNYTMATWFEDNPDDVADVINFYPYYESYIIISKFYDGHLITTETVNDYRTLPDMSAPSSVTIEYYGGYPEGKEFAFWKFEDNTILHDGLTFIPVDNIIKTEIQDGVIKQSLNLYVGLKTEGVAYDAPDIDDNTPEDIRTLFNGFGLDNDVGYFFVLLFIILAITLFLASIKAPIVLYIIGYLGAISLFTWLGLIPIFASIILYLLSAVFGAVMINGRLTDYE